MRACMYFFSTALAYLSHQPSSPSSDNASATTSPHTQAFASRPCRPAGAHLLLLLLHLPSLPPQGCSGAEVPTRRSSIGLLPATLNYKIKVVTKQHGALYGPSIPAIRFCAGSSVRLALGRWPLITPFHADYGPLHSISPLKSARHNSGECGLTRESPFFMVI